MYCRAVLLPLVKSLRQSEKVAVVGASGAGKTAIIRELLPDLRRSHLVLAYDYYEELGLPIAKSLSDASWNLKEYRATAWSRSELTGPMLQQIAARGNCILIVDEAQRIWPRHQSDYLEYLKLANEGRHYGIGLLWATQEPHSCSKRLLSNCQCVAVGRLLQDSDLQAVGRWGCRKPLPQYRFYVLHSDNSSHLVESKRFD